MCKAYMITLLLLVFPTASGYGETITLELPDAEAQTGSRTDVAVELTGAKRMVAWQFVINYDPALLKVVEVTAGDLLEGSSLEANYDSPGRIAIAGARFQPVAGEGRMLTITFEVIGTNTGQSKLSIESAEAWQENETEILIETTDGSLTISAAAFAWPSWWPLALGGGLLVLALALAPVFLRKRKSKDQKAVHALHPHDSRAPTDGKIHIKCPHCGGSLAASPDAAGHTGKCVKCGHSLVIPPMAKVG